jgi:ankyrin repeat protein
MLLEAKADVNARGPNSVTPLMVALGNKNAEVATAMIAAKADVNHISDAGSSVIDIARRSCPSLVGALCAEAGTESTDPKVQGQYLLSAVKYNSTETIKRLIDAGADLTAVNSDKKDNIVSLAARFGNRNTMKIVLDAVSPSAINYTNDSGLSPLDVAVIYGNMSNVRALIAAKADVNHTSGTAGRTVLMKALNKPKIMKALIEANADVNRVSLDGTHNALQFAAYKDYRSSADVLIAAKANVDDACNNGSTPLKTALFHRHVGFAKKLVAAGADTITDRKALLKSCYSHNIDPAVIGAASGSNKRKAGSKASNQESFLDDAPEEDAIIDDTPEDVEEKKDADNS